MVGLQETLPSVLIFNMATIYNSNLSKELIDVAKLQVSKDVVPNQIADKIVPVIDVNPKHSRVINVIVSALATNSTAGSLYVTPTDRDFYLSAIDLSMIKDATATSLYSCLRAVINGATILFCRIPGITLTAQTGSISVAFPSPIKIDRGTTISLINSTNVANVTVAGTIYGYIIDNSNA